MINKRIEFQVPENLYKTVIEFCKENYISISTFIRQLLVYFLNPENNKKISIKNKEFSKDLLFEVNRYGNNINQIAYKLNVALKTTDLSYTDKKDVLEAIEALKRQTTTIQEIKNLIGERL